MRRAAPARRARRSSKMRRLQGEDPLVGAQDAVLVLLELRGDEALAARDRLLADVVGGDVAEVRLADLDVVAEDPVEAHLERRDAGARRARAPRSRRSSRGRPGWCPAARRARDRRRRGRSPLRARAREGRPPGCGRSRRRGRGAGRAPSPAGAGAGPGSRRGPRPRPGSARRDWPRATRSRGPAVPRVTRPRMRSRSCTPPKASRRRPRSRARKASSSTASSRSWMRSSSTRGRRIHSRSRRPPMAVRVWSRTSRSVPRRPPSARLSTSSRLRRVSESRTRTSWEPRVTRLVTWARSRFWVSRT